MTVAGANQQRSINKGNFQDPARSGNNVNSGRSSMVSVAAAVAFADISVLREALLQDAGYTAAAVDNMTTNDMRHALDVYLKGGGTVNVDLGTLPTHTEDTSDPTTSDIAPWGTVWINTATPEVFQGEGVDSAGDAIWTSLWSGV